MIKCGFCHDREADAVLTLYGQPVCLVCAHSASNGRALRPNEIPTVFTDTESRVTPYGVFPNIDWT
jgi:hypothetical protein